MATREELYVMFYASLIPEDEHKQMQDTLAPG